MKTFSRLALSAATLAAFTACPTTDETETGALCDTALDSACTTDTGTVEPTPLAIGAIDVAACSAAFGNPTGWNYYVRAEGWGGGVTIDVIDTGDMADGTARSAVWDESHILSITASSAENEDPQWDDWEINLDIVTTTGAVDNDSSLFGCATHGDGCSLAFRVTLFDDVNAAADCALYGFNVAAGWPNDSSCTNFGAEVNDAGQAVTCN